MLYKQISFEHKLCSINHYNNNLQLQQDFDKFISSLGDRSLIPKDSLHVYSSMLKVEWPHLAKKILIHAKKLKVPEVVHFMSKYKDLIDQGNFLLIFKLLIFLMYFIFLIIL